MKRVLQIALAVLVSFTALLVYIIVHSVVNGVGRIVASFGLDSGLSIEQRQEAIQSAYAASAATRFIISGLIFITLAVIAVHFLRRLNILGFRNVYLLPPKGSSNILPCAAAAVLLGMTLNVACSSLIQLIPIPTKWIEDNAESVSAMSDSNIILYLIATGIIAPIAEELLFRCIFYNSIRRIVPTVIAAVLTSLIFGWFHGNILQAIYCFVFSLLMIIIMIRTDSLLSAALMHIGFNNAWLLSSLLGKLYSGEKILLNSILYTLISTALIILIFLLTVNNKNNGNSSDNNDADAANYEDSVAVG